MKTVISTSPRHRSVFSALGLPLLACAAMLAGCTNDDSPYTGDLDGRTPVTFSTTIQTALPQAAAHAAPGTRTATDANGNATWTQGDAVSISMLTAGGTLPGDILPDCANVRYNVDPITGTLTPASGTPMYYPQSPQDAKVDFIAWHSATAPGEDYILTLSTGDQATAEKQLALDPLYSDNAKSITPGTAPVPLQFRHLMSKVKFDLTLGFGLTGGTVTDVRLEGMIETASFDLRDGSVKDPLAPANPISALPSDAASDGADATYTALLIPQGAKTNATPRTIIVTVNGKEYSGPIPNEHVFTANAMCVYPVTVNGDVVEVGIPTTDVPWAEGELPTVTIGDKTFRLIRDADDLKQFADDVNGGQRDLNAIQTADIDLGGIENWTPISWGYNLNPKPFTGIYNGNGYTISCLTIRSQTGECAGLFGVIGNGALLTGIHLRDVEITTQPVETIGALAGNVLEGATISLCSAGGEIDVSGISPHAGGLAGSNDGTITRCRTNVAVTAYAMLSGQTYTAAGGIAGINAEGGLLYVCHATGPVILTARNEDNPGFGGVYAGGITGFNTGFTSSSNIYCCISEGNVSAEAETAVAQLCAGGLAGYLVSGVIVSSYARGNAVAQGGKAGAILGWTNIINDVQSCYGTGAGGVGTSNVYETAAQIGYNTNPKPREIIGFLKSRHHYVEKVPFTEYAPQFTPAYGIGISLVGIDTYNVWLPGDDTWPVLDFMRNK